MKKAKLTKLSLRNFRNIEALDLSFDGNSQIVGENHVGKTNTLEAIVFLLTDKLLTGSSDVAAVKPMKDTSLTVTVEAEFKLDDGTAATIRRDYREKWVTTRGTDVKTMQGHEEILWFNGVKQPTAKAFNGEIREFFGISGDDPEKIEVIRMLSIPGYLGDMGESKDWTALRSYIIKLVGDVSDSDVFAGSPELKPIEDDLKAMNGKVDQLKKKYKQDRDGIVATIQQTEGQISLLTETKRPTDDEVAIAKAGVEKHQTVIANLRSSLGTDVASAAIAERLAAKSDEFARLLEEGRKNDPSNAKKAQIASQISETRSKIEKLASDRMALLNRRMSLEAEQGSAKRELDLVSKSVNESLIEKIREIDAKIANPEVRDVCPTCGQPLPASEVQSAKDALVAQLNAKRGELVEACKSNKAKRAEAEAKAERLAAELESVSIEITKVNVDVSTLNETIGKLQAEYDSVPTGSGMSEQAAKAKEELESIRAELEESKRRFAAGQQDNSQAVLAEQEAMKPFQEVLDNLAYYERQMSVLQSKKADLDRLRKGLAAAEQKSYLVSEFVKQKLTMLDKNVSKVFGNIRFKLISENINGGYDPVCKAYIYDSVKGESTGVLWASGSKSERVETGIAICEAIKAAAGLPSLPYLFDEGGEISAGTFSQRLKTESQIICVRVVDDVMAPTVRPIN